MPKNFVLILDFNTEMGGTRRGGKTTSGIKINEREAWSQQKWRTGQIAAHKTAPLETLTRPSNILLQTYHAHQPTRINEKKKSLIFCFPIAVRTRGRQNKEGGGCCVVRTMWRGRDSVTEGAWLWLRTWWSTRWDHVCRHLRVRAVCVAINREATVKATPRSQILRQPDFPR